MPFSNTVIRIRIAFRRFFRGESSPHAIALGVAVGTYVSCLPTVGQTLLAFFTAWFLRANKTAAVFMANWHVPFLICLAHWAFQTELGLCVLGQPMGYHDIRALIVGLSLTNPQAWKGLGHILLGWIVGAQILGIPAAVIGYHLTYRAAAAYQARRHAVRQRLFHRRRKFDGAQA